MPERKERNETLEQMTRRKLRTSVPDGIQIVKKLLEIIDQVHKEQCLFLSLNPNNIRIHNCNHNCYMTVSVKPVDERSVIQIKKRKAVVDTIGFRAPEVALANEYRIGRQSDYYSLTALLYYIISGNKPDCLQMFQHKIPDLAEVIETNEMNEAESYLLSKILKKGLSPNLKCRYQTAEEIMNDLTKLEKRFAAG